MTASSLALLVMPVFAEQAGDGASWLQFIASELRQMRIELLEQHVAAETGRIEVIEQAIAALRLEQNQMKNEERAQQQQVADLDRQMEHSGTDSETRVQLQSAKTELMSAGTARFQAAHAIATARDTALAERVRLARSRLDALAQKLKALSSPTR